MKDENNVAQPKQIDKCPSSTSHFHRWTVVYVSFCSSVNGITPKIRMLCFVSINSVLLHRLCVWILFDWSPQCPQLYFNPSDVVVTFDLLDRPPHYGDVQTAGKQNSLVDATHLLEDSFKMHTLTFFFAAGVNVLVSFVLFCFCCSCCCCCCFCFGLFLFWGLLLSFFKVQVQCCLRSTNTIRTIRDGEHRTATSTFI